MNVLQAIVLGFIQGATEFLPVSSSGHLILAPFVMGIKTQPLVFDTILHLATALTLVVVFFKDYLRMFIRFLHKPFELIANGEPGLILIALASIPAGLLGLLLDSFIENSFRGHSYVLIFMALGTVLLFIAEKFGKPKKDNPSAKQSIIIGGFQALALFPGVSRSGATISGGMLLGLKRESAARFAFLISVPIVVAAALFKILGTDWNVSPLSFTIILSGFFSSFFTGLIAVRFLLKYLHSNSLYPFILYRIFVIMLLALISL